MNFLNQMYMIVCLQMFSKVFNIDIMKDEKMGESNDLITVKGRCDWGSLSKEITLNEWSKTFVEWRVFISPK